MSEHTKEPWYGLDGEDYIFASNGAEDFQVCLPMGDTTEEATANARRIVACVNYCAGKSIEELKRAPLQQETDKDGERPETIKQCAKRYGWMAKNFAYADGTVFFDNIPASPFSTLDGLIDAAIAALPQKDSKI